MSIWTRFNTAMPEPDRPIITIWCDVNHDFECDIGSTIRPGLGKTDQARLDKLLSNPPVFAYRPAGWAYVELGHCTDEGFGLAFYRQAGRGDYQKANSADHANMLAHGKWAYLTDLVRAADMHVEFPIVTVETDRPVEGTFIGGDNAMALTLDKCEADLDVVS